MKLPRRFLLLLPFLWVAAFSAAPEVAPLVAPFEPDPAILAAPYIETAWKPLSQLTDMDYLMGFLGSAKGTDRQVKIRELMGNSLRVSLAFYQKYPTDPRRWMAVRNLLGGTQFFANPDGSQKQPFGDLPWDQVAWAAWVKQIEALDAQIATAPDAPSALRLSAETQKPGGLADMGKVIGQATTAKEPVDFAPFKQEFLRLVALYPDAKLWTQYTPVYLKLYSQTGATKEQQLAEAKSLAAVPSPLVSAAAQKEIEKLTGSGRPPEIAFTAIDGRKVDLKDYRGKVVLVDFWATWCGPCIRELPNVKRVYMAYHDKGFDVIGISLENAHLSPDDTAEQAAAKHEKAKQVLNEFTAKNEMPWPQYYDGKFWKNDLSTRFDIASIPAMFLIDQDGKLVSTEARGPELEKEVKRLLKL